jgi:hypothetical protein
VPRSFDGALSEPQRGTAERLEARLKARVSGLRGERRWGPWKLMGFRDM